MAYGMRSSIGLVRENSLDVLAGARTDYIEALSESIALNIERFEVANVYGGNYERNDLAGLRRVEGDISFTGNAHTLGFALAGAMGVSSTAVVTSGTLYQHTFTRRASDPEVRRPLDTYSIEVARDVTSAHIYTGMAWSKLSINAQPNQAVQVTATMVGISAAVGSASTPTFPGSPFNPFTFDTTSVQIDGAATAIMEALTFEIDNQLEAIPALNNSTVARKIKRGGPQLIRLSGTLCFDDLTEYQRFSAQSTMRMVCTWTRAASFMLQLDLPQVVYTAFPVNAGGRERLTVGFEGQGQYHSGSASAIRMDLWNTKSGYPQIGNGLT